MRKTCNKTLVSHQQSKISAEASSMACKNPGRTCIAFMHVKESKPHLFCEQLTLIDHQSQ